MSEWSIVLPWKGSVESNQPGVRIVSEVRILSSPKLLIIHLLYEVRFWKINPIKSIDETNEFKSPMVPVGLSPYKKIN